MLCEWNERQCVMVSDAVQNISVALLVTSTCWHDQNVFIDLGRIASEVVILLIILFSF